MAFVQQSISDLMLKGMLATIKEEVVARVEADLIEDYRSRIKPIINEAAANLIIGRIQQAHDALNLRERIFVEVHNGGEVTEAEVK